MKMEVVVFVCILAFSRAFPTQTTRVPLPEILNEVMQHNYGMSSQSIISNATTITNFDVPLPQIKKHPNITHAIGKLDSLKTGKSRTLGTLAEFAAGGLLAALDLAEDIIAEDNDPGNELQAGSFPRTPRQQQETVTRLPATTHQAPSTEFSPETTTEVLQLVTTLRQIAENQDFLNEVQVNLTNIRQTRQEEDEEEGGGGLLGAIISGFLGSLSKPDGGVDVDAVVSVIGMLSAMREDGTYDFQGLQDTLSAFFGGDDEGGSDVGSFLGGLLAAVIGGVASPPGAKGAGTFAGNVLKQLVPALSGPPPAQEGAPTPKPGKPQVNAGGFLFGLLNTLFGDGNTSGMKPFSSLVTIKTNIVKFLLAAISSILTTSSSSGKNNW